MLGSKETAAGEKERSQARSHLLMTLKNVVSNLLGRARRSLTSIKTVESFGEFGLQSFRFHGNQSLVLCIGGDHHRWSSMFGNRNRPLQSLVYHLSEILFGVVGCNRMHCCSL